MIKYNKELKAFMLSGKSYTYAMYINVHGMLQNVYYGAKISDFDLNYAVSKAANNGVPAIDDINKDCAYDYLPSECGFFGHGDFREPTLIIERNDGSTMSRFKYKSHKIKTTLPDLAGMPHIRKGGKTLSIVLKDDFSATEITLNYTVFENSDVIVRNSEIKNVGKEKISLKRAYSFCLELENGEYSTLRLAGRWANERAVQIAPVVHGTTRLETLRGASSHLTNPFMGILRDKCDENTGECYGVQLIYSGSFAIDLAATTNGPIRIQGGVNDINFNWKLNSKEKFVTPQVAICYSSEGLGQMSRSYSDFLREYVINPNYSYNQRPIVVNNWEATYFNFNNEKLFAIIDEAAKLGIDTFVLDDGWFGKRDDDRTSLGDWFVNEEKLKGGIDTVINYCIDKGLKFGLWFEPEMISEKSVLYKEHPDFAIQKQGVEPVRSRNQLVLDFSRDDVVEYVYGMLSKMLKMHKISYVKWDMNRNITECYSSALPEDRQGELMHRYILGVYKLAEKLTNEFPNVIFEGCAGGGGRFDAGMLYYFPQIWTSDDTDAYERTKIQWGTSICYPLSAMSCHVSACPNHQTNRVVPYKTRGVIASLGATGYELDLSKLSDDEKAQTKQQIEDYKKISSLILNGDLYRLSNPFNTNYFCFSVVAKDKKYIYVAGERFRGVPCDFARILKLKGLAPEKKYFVEELNITATGKALMNVGLTIPFLGDNEAWCWHIYEK